MTSNPQRWAGIGGRVGSHVARRAFAAEAEARTADIAQVFLGNPRGWKAGQPLSEAELGLVGFEPGQIPLVVHATYLINVVSATDEVRQKSIHALAEELDTAAKSRALGVVVHAGSAGKGGTAEQSLVRWRQAAEQLAEAGGEVGLWVENVATGNPHPGRDPHGFVETVSAIQEIMGRRAGTCVDTCHAWAGGWTSDDAATVAETVGVALIHLNGSNDDWGSGRDRHDNLPQSRIPPSWLDELTSSISETQGFTPAVIVETPGGEEAQREDIIWWRARRQT